MTAFPVLFFHPAEIINRKQGSYSKYFFDLIFA